MPSQEYILKYKDVSKLKGLGWIEYTLPFVICTNYTEWQTSIELDSIILVCFI